MLKLHKFANWVVDLFDDWNYGDLPGGLYNDVVSSGMNGCARPTDPF